MQLQEMSIQKPHCTHATERWYTCIKHSGPTFFFLWVKDFTIVSKGQGTPAGTFFKPTANFCNLLTPVIKNWQIIALYAEIKI
jgi:hypothetical protein